MTFPQPGFWARTTAAALAIFLALGTPAAVGEHRVGPKTESVWELGTGAYVPADYRRQPYVGNGYLSQRLPATGTGYQGGLGETGWPLYDERYAGAHAAGFHHRSGDDEFLAALPTWSTLTLSDGADSLTPGTAVERISRYRQSLDLRGATVSTTYTWTPRAGRATRVAYDVLSHRSRQNLGLVRLRVTPSWSGRLDVSGLFDGAGARRTTPVARSAGEVTVAAEGSGRRITETAALVAGPGTRFADRKAVLPQSTPQTAGERVGIEVEAGRTYEVVKYIGVAATPTAARGTVTEARRAGLPRLMREHRAAWAELWRPTPLTPGRDDLQKSTNSALYALYSSVRAGQPWSLGPSGLSSDNYAGQIYWDADTWMFPALLATHPELARSVVEYRYRTLGQARRNAAAVGRKGGVWPWTAGPSGLCSGIGPCKDYQDHLQNEIALAQWQFYAATGDAKWLRERGFPVLSAVADFWADRAVKGADGKYHVNKVSGADEYAHGVDDHALTNGGAIVALRHAAQAARRLGKPVPTAWEEVAEQLYVPQEADGSHPEYAGYKGQKIKQADTVLLTYPYGYVTDPVAAQADLDRYAPVTDPDGPAMTDSAHAVIAAQVGADGCQTDTYLERSYRPFVKGPFLQFSEARGDKAGDNAGAPAFTFLTGAGGFLQTLPYAIGGLRWDADALRLDPVLTPGLSHGVRLEHIAWQGRDLAVRVGARTTDITLRSGPSMTVRLPDGAHPLKVGGTLTTPTRRPDLAATDNLARCRPASAVSETAGGYAEAAVDGSTATAWTATLPRSALTVRLAEPSRVTHAEVVFGAGRPDSVRLEGRAPDGSWRPLTADTAAPESGTLRMAVAAPGAVREVRLIAESATTPATVSELRLMR
ncbi:glycosyl hydrolase family 65 protein [Streptomyces sp. NPDC091272]|uniref:glycosyl hydrolase family 65 protein n=1 Tax=Streptomyces sp. NPDC091272 TaxID=3365981 RepID=UPI003813806D